MIDLKGKGDRLFAAEVNEINARLTALESMSSGNGIRMKSIPGGGVALQGDQTLDLGMHSAVQCLAVNKSGVDLPAWSPAGVLGNHFTTPTNLRNRVALSIRVPISGDEGKWVCTAEPIKNNRAGRVWVGGVFPVRMISSGAAAVRAEISAGQTYLVGNDSGSCQVLFEENLTGAVHIAVVRWTGTAAGLGGVIACKAATTGNHGLSGLSAVDGVSLADKDLVMVWKQTTTSTNGIYRAKSGTWEKVAGFDAYQAVSVALGTLYGKTLFVSTGANAVTYIEGRYA